MPSTGKVLARASTHTRAYTNPKTETTYTLTTYLDVSTALSAHRGHQVLNSTLWYEARFSLKQPVEGKAKSKSKGKTERGKSVGHLYAYVVDKTKVSKESGGLAWIEELLTPALASKAKAKRKGKKKANPVEDERTELQLVLQELFDTEGQVKDQVANHSQELQAGDRIVFIDGFILSEAYRGTGLAQQCVTTFLRQLPLVNKDRAVPAGTSVVLSPAASGDVRKDDGKSDVEIERGLVRSYERSGFEVWIQGDEAVEGSVTVMGRMVPEEEKEDEETSSSEFGT